MNLAEYHASESELLRLSSLERLVKLAKDTRNALDIGARDGYFSLMLAQYVDQVVALDLTTPQIEHPDITCLEGDATCLDIPDNAFDLVLCSEVIEHIAGASLQMACYELQRVTARYLLVGVPYRQDTRVGRTTCRTCGGKNPPWGHVNTFDRDKLLSLFSSVEPIEIDYVGTNNLQTNALSARIMDLAGNPYGTYEQSEPCIHCGAQLDPPKPRNLAKKILTKAAFMTRALSRPFSQPHPTWIHILFEKTGST